MNSDYTPVEGISALPQQTKAPSYRYRLCRELDSGGMATVYLARMEGPGGFEKLVALKSIHPHLANRREIVEMFLDEAQIVAELNHPNVCTVVDFGCVNDTYFIAMEYLFGENLSRLARRIRRDGVAPPRWHAYVAYIIAGAAEGLHAAHELRDAAGNPRNVVHRDVTPNNICIAYDGSIRVMDFGIARAEGQLHETKAISLKGKVPYMSPEQFIEAQPIDRRADVWSLGVVLWELLTLKRLFRRDSDPQTALAICNGPIADPREIDPTIPEVLAHATLAALNRDVNQRLATTRELSKQLRGYLATLGEPIGMPEISELMGNVFERERRERQELVDDAKTMTDPAPLASLSSGSLRLLEIANGTPSASLVETTLETEVATVATVAATHPQTEAAPPVSIRRRSPLVFVVGAAAAVAIALFAFLALDGRSGPSEPGVAASPTSEPAGVIEGAEPAKNVEPTNEVPNAATEAEPEATRDAESKAAQRDEVEARQRREARERRAEEKLLAREKKAQQEKERALEKSRKEEAAKRDREREIAAAETLRRKKREEDAAKKRAELARKKAELEKKERLAREERDKREAAIKVPQLVPFKVSISVTASGALSRNEVMRAVKKKQGKFGECYASSRKKAGRDAFGTIKARIRIGSSRQAKVVAAGSHKLPGLAACIKRQLASVRTVNASDTGDTNASVRVTFKAR